MKIEYDPQTKRWHTRVQIDGRRERLYGETKTEVADLAHDLIAKHRRQRLGLATVTDTSVTYGALVERFLAQYPHKEQSRTALTDRLKHSLRTFVDTRAHDLTRETIQTWLNGLTTLDKTARPLAPSSKRGALKAMRQILRWAVQVELLGRNPAADVQPPRIDSDSAHPFEEWQEVFAVANVIGERHRPLVLFWAATGLRAEELLALRWCDLRLSDTTPALTVRRTIQAGAIVELVAKTRGSLRTVPLQPLALEALALLPRPLDSQQLVFPGVQGATIDLAAFRREGGPWRKALNAAGLDHRPPKHLRHTFATLSLTAGVPIEAVSRMLGHDSILTTQRYYARWLPAADERIVQQLAKTTPAFQRPEVASDSENEASAL